MVNKFEKIKLKPKNLFLFLKQLYKTQLFICPLISPKRMKFNPTKPTNLLAMKKSILLICVLLTLQTNVIFAQDAEALKQQVLFSNNDTLKEKALVQLSNLWVRNKSRDFLDILTSLKQIAEKKDNKLLKTNTYHQFALAYTNLRKYDSAHLFYKKAFSENKQLKNQALQGILLNDVAYCFYVQNILDSSLIYYEQALDIKQKLGNKKNIATTLNGIGLVYRTRNNLETAIEYYNKALKIYESLNSSETLSVLMNIATIYNLDKKYDSANSLFKQVYQQAEKAKNTNMMLTSRINLAIGLNYQAKYAEALPIFLELEQNPIVKKIEDLSNAIQYGLGQAYAGLHQCEKAIPILEKCLNMRFKNTKFQSLAAITHLLYECEKQNNNYVKALAHYEQLKIYSDSIISAKNLENINELKTKYQTKEKEQQIEILNKDNQLKDLSLQQQYQTILLKDAQNKQKQQEIELLNSENILKEVSLQQQQQALELTEAKSIKAVQKADLLQKENTLNILTIKNEKRTKLLFGLGLGCISIIAGFVLLLYIQKKQASRLLEAKNDIISKSLEEKEVLLKEIHHRVKNNLQVVSSLLNLQTRNINDATALAAIKEGRDRVRSMALLHQNLYQDNNLTGVDVKNYIELLAQSLLQSYNINTETIGLITNVQELQLDVETVLPIGLILNELISNALKYAFDESAQKGKLEVILQQQNNQLVLEVKDNGKGLPADWNYNNLTSLGYQLIKSFVQKMKGELIVTNNSGTQVQIRINKYKLAV